MIEIKNKQISGLVYSLRRAGYPRNIDEPFNIIDTTILSEKRI